MVLQDLAVLPYLCQIACYRSHHADIGVCISSGRLQWTLDAPRDR